MPTAPPDGVVRLATVILEAVAVNVMFAVEADPASRSGHLLALRRFVGAALRGLASPDAELGA